MRGVVWLVLLFTVAVVAASTFGRNDGLVSIYWNGWRTDLSLNLAVLLVLGLCLVLTLGLQAVQALTSLPRRASEWRTLRKERAAQAALREALVELLAARYGRAQKAAVRALDIQRDTPSMSGDAEFAALTRLLAATGAHRLQDRPRRDQWLAEAMRPGVASRTDEAARLLAAEWALEDLDGERAGRWLGELPAGVSRRTQAMRLKLQAARLLGDTDAALRMARLLANHGAFSDAAARSLLRSLAFDALQATHDLEQLSRVWSALDVADRRDPLVAARAAVQAALLGAPAEGRGWIRPFWERLESVQRDEREKLALALIEALDGLDTDWLPRLEAAQAGWPHEPAVMAAVALGYAECQLWGKARRPLQHAADAPTLPSALRRRALRELAVLASQEGDAERARAHERAAAALE